MEINRREILPDDEEFLSEIWSRLVSFAWHLIRDAHAAEDMAQETVVHYIRKRSEVRVGREAAWLFSTCRNLCRNLRRKIRPVPLDGNEVVTGDQSRSIAARLDLARALEVLPQSQQDLFLLRVLGELTVPQLADVLAIPEGTVKSRLFHITMKLRPRLQGYEGRAANEL